MTETRSPYDASTPRRPGLRASREMWNSLTRREIFAAMAMQGLLGNNELLQVFPEDSQGYADLGEACCRIADALIAELDRNKP